MYFFKVLGFQCLIKSTIARIGHSRQKKLLPRQFNDVLSNGNLFQEMAIKQFLHHQEHERYPDIDGQRRNRLDQMKITYLGKLQSYFSRFKCHSRRHQIDAFSMPTRACKKILGMIGVEKLVQKHANWPLEL